MQHLLHIPKSRKKREIYFIDMLAYLAGIIAPIMALPQLWEIWILKNTAGVSVLSWGSFAFFNLIFVIYGIANKEKLIIITNTIWFFLQSLIAIGVLIYR